MSLRFPQDEIGLPWLSMLMDAFDLADENVRRVAERDRVERGLEIACHGGCGSCCSQQPIPLTSLELSGIIWFIRRKMTPKARSKVEHSIRVFPGETGCPLVVEGKCSVYPVRPVICRHFNVYSRPCEGNEDVVNTRPEHVMTPDHDMAQETYRTMLPFYNITTAEDQLTALKGNYLFRLCSVFMHKVDWDAVLRGAK